MSSPNRSRIVAAAFVVALALGAAGAHAQSATLVNVAPTPHRATPGATLADVGAAVRGAVEAAGWKIESEGPGESIASIWVRGKHQAVVRIGYDLSSFWIDYESSVNLEYTPHDRPPRFKGGRPLEGPRIHRNYNGWVKRLAKHIRRAPVRAGRAPAAFEPAAEAADAAPSETPALVADELEKLRQLHERGILTAEEFAEQKAKLLAR